MRIYIYVSIIFLFVNCAGKTSCEVDTVNKASNIIDLTLGLKNSQTIRLSEIADSVTFIPFETTSENLMGQGQRNIIFSIPYIFYYNNYFDWNGNFLGSIIKRGQGPYEEPEGGTLLYKDNHFYSKGSKFIEYDISGKPTGKVRDLFKPSEFKDNDFLRWGSDFSVVGENFIIYNYPTDLYFFNNNFDLISSRRVINVDSVKSIYGKIGDQKTVTYYKGHALFYNFINDTIFYVTNAGLEPKWVVSFNDPSRLPTQAILNSLELRKEMLLALRNGNIESPEFNYVDNKHKVIGVYETESYLFFQMTEIILMAEPRGKQRPEPYIVYYEKKTGKAIRVKGKGFIDDLLGMDFFYPQLGVFDEKLITYIWPYELLDYIDECSDKGCEVNQKLISLSKRINSEDNPILILVHLKK